MRADFARRQQQRTMYAHFISAWIGSKSAHDADISRKCESGGLRFGRRFILTPIEQHDVNTRMRMHGRWR